MHTSFYTFVCECASVPCPQLKQRQHTCMRHAILVVVHACIEANVLVKYECLLQVSFVYASPLPLKDLAAVYF